MSLGVVVWFTGLPASGKSTLAQLVRDALREREQPCVILDGDEVRSALVPKPGYSDAEREKFYVSLGNLALLIASQGHIVLVPATANRADYRDRVRAKASCFIEVYTTAPVEECRQRDIKGLYAQARADSSVRLPGAGDVYESPLRPEITATGGHDSEAAGEIVERIVEARRKAAQA